MKLRTLFLSWLLSLIAIVLCYSPTFGQDKSAYQQAYTQIVGMLEGKDSLSFKKAVFLTENAYLDNKLSYDKFSKQIKLYSQISHTIRELITAPARGLFYCATLLFFFRGLNF